MKNDLEKRPYISIILLLLAFILLSATWFVAVSLGVVYFALKGETVKYLFNVAIALDNLVATIIFGTYDHTVSAIIYKRKYHKSVAFVNWLFRDSTHCARAYVEEYGSE